MVRVNETTGIEIEPAVMEQLQLEPKMFERSEVLDYLDVVGLKVCCSASFPLCFAHCAGAERSGSSRSTSSIKPKGSSTT